MFDRRSAPRPRRIRRAASPPVRSTSHMQRARHKRGAASARRITRRIHRMSRGARASARVAVRQGRKDGASPLSARQTPYARTKSPTNAGRQRRVPVACQMDPIFPAARMRFFRPHRHRSCAAHRFELIVERASRRFRDPSCDSTISTSFGAVFHSSFVPLVSAGAIRRTENQTRRRRHRARDAPQEIDELPLVLRRGEPLERLVRSVREDDDVRCAVLSAARRSALRSTRARCGFARR